MSDETLTYLVAAVALSGLMAYAVLAGADFGGGVWDLLAFGPRRHQQRELIAHAIGPVWEANHVWLIFVIVILFTCFPQAYAVLVTALFVPMHLVLMGIMLRGAAFIFRGYGPSDSDEEKSRAFGHYNVWGVVFGAASVVSPLLLGASFGVVTGGDVRVGPAGAVTLSTPVPWLSLYPLACGLLALSTCANLAAVYLTVETDGDVREDFRRRALISVTVTAVLAIVALLAARRQAPWFAGELFLPRVWTILLAGGVCFVGAAVAVLYRRFRLARVLSAGQTVIMLLGWGVAHRGYLIYPDVLLLTAAGPRETLRFILLAVPVGLAAVVPSLLLLLRVFKSQTGLSRRA